jgi:hypothetical protein
MFAAILILLLVVRYSFSVTVASVGDLNATGVDVPPQTGGSPPESAATSISRNQARWSSLAPPFSAATMAPARCGRRKRVVIYTRYSTNEQNEQSLADQEAVCRGAVDRCSLADAEIEVLSDAAVSGEMANRRGVDRPWELIETQACDIIVAEEVSRLYRHTARAMQFIESAVDAGICVITLNDPIDTATDDWRLNGHFASLKAEFDDRQTRQRIERAKLVGLIPRRPVVKLKSDAC